MRWLLFPILGLSISGSPLALGACGSGDDAPRSSDAPGSDGQAPIDGQGSAHDGDPGRDPDKPPPQTYATFEEARVDLWAKAIAGPDASGPGFCGKSKAIWVDVLQSTDTVATFHTWNPVSGVKSDHSFSKPGFWHASDDHLAMVTVVDGKLGVKVYALDGTTEAYATIDPGGAELYPVRPYVTDTSVFVAFGSTNDTQRVVLRRWDIATKTLTDVATIAPALPSDRNIGFFGSRAAVISGAAFAVVDLSTRSTSSLTASEVGALLAPLPAPNGLFHTTQKEVEYFEGYSASAPRKLLAEVTAIPPIFPDRSTEKPENEHRFSPGAMVPYRGYAIYNGYSGLWAYELTKKVVLPVQPLRGSSTLFCSTSETEHLIFSFSSVFALPLGNVLP